MKLTKYIIIALVAFAVIACKSSQNSSKVDGLFSSGYKEVTVTITGVDPGCIVGQVAAGWGMLTKLALDEKGKSFENNWEEHLKSGFSSDNTPEVATGNSFKSRAGGRYFVTIRCPNQPVEFAYLTANEKYPTITLEYLNPSTTYPADDYTTCWTPGKSTDKQLSNCMYPNKVCELTSDKNGPVGKCKKIDFPAGFEKHITEYRRPCNCEPLSN